MPCETDPGLVSRVMGIRSRAGASCPGQPALWQTTQAGTP